MWDEIPGHKGEEAWLKEVRPVVQLDGEDRNTVNLIGKVHAALSEAGLRRRAQRFITRAYYVESYDEVLGVAMEFVEFIESE